MPSTQTQSLDAVTRDVLTRGLAVIGLLGIALVHILDAIPTFSELPYEGWLYIALIVSSLVLAGCLVRSASREVWLATAALAGAAILAYVYSRTVGLPRAGDDIGNWSEPLGVAALFVEGAVLAVAGYALTGVVRPRSAGEGAALITHPA